MPDRDPRSVRESNPRNSAALAAFVALAALLAYSNSLRGGWVLDDQTAILENASIRALADWRAVLAPPTSAGVGGRPLANLTFALNHALSGTEPWSYRLTSIVLHAAIALVLFGIVRRTLMQPPLRGRFGVAGAAVAAAAAGLWAVHPLTTAVVDYVSQRTEQLMALFYVLALYGFVRGVAAPTKRWLAFSVACCALGMAAKEVMVTAPLAIALYDRTFVAGSFRAAWAARWRYYGALAATWGVLAGLMLTSRVAERGVGLGLGVPVLTYLATECQAVLLYLKLSLWPNPLVFDYGWAFAKPADVWPHAVALSVLLAISAICLWRKSPLGFCAAWFFGILAPTSSIIPVVHQPIAESRVYLPLAAVTTCLALGLHAALGRRAHWAVLLAGLALGLAAFDRNRDYRNPLTLWRDTLAKQPRNARAHNNLAGTLLNLNRPAEALNHAAEAVRLHPGYADARLNLGAAHAAHGRLAEAAEHYRAAIASDAGHAAAHANLGNILILLGKPAEARPHLETAIRLNPTLPQPHNDLGVLLLSAGQYEDSLRHEEIAIRLAPRMADAHYNRGNALARLRRFDEAIAAFREALRLRPSDAKAHNNLGAVLLLSGRPAAAVPHFEAAVRLNPAHADARRNLDAAREASGR